MREEEEQMREELANDAPCTSRLLWLVMKNSRIVDSKSGSCEFCRNHNNQKKAKHNVDTQLLTFHIEQSSALKTMISLAVI